MSPTYQQNKVHIMKWRATHSAYFTETNRKRAKLAMRYKREAAIFRNILL